MEELARIKLANVFKEPIYNEVMPVSECNDKKKAFYECVITQKNELTKNMSANEWQNYKYKVHDIESSCFKEGGMSDCESYYSLYDIKY